MTGTESKAKLATGSAPASGPWGVAAALAGVTLLAFWPLVDGQFLNWDDDQNFLKNLHFRGLGAANLRWMFTTFHLGHYHPLTWLSLALDYTFWGLNPRGYHLTNLLLHAANGVVFYWVARRLLGGRSLPAATAAALFALHPLRVESVAWVSERRDVLSGLFYLLSALAYLRAQQEGPRRRWMVVSVVVFAAALLSKVIVVSLPVALLALDFYPLRRRWSAALLVEKIPYVLLGGGAAVAALALQPAGVSGFAEHATVLPALRLGLSVYGLAFYLWKTVWPLALYPQYVYAPDVLPADLRILWSGAIVTGLTILLVAWRRRFPAALAVWVCYVASLLPVLSIARVDPQQYVADHHTYLATLGLALLAAAGVSALTVRYAVGTVALLVLPLGVLTNRQAGVWHDSVRLWTHAVAGSPDSAVSRNNLGEALAAAGRLEEALPHFERAVQIKPHYAHGHYNLGHSRQQRGDLDAATKHFLRAIEAEPGYAAAHNDLANCYTRAGRLDAALEHYEQALRYRPAYADAHYNLANLLQRQRQFERAIGHYREALAIDPARADAHNNWGVALDELGRSADAIEQYRQALRLEPQNADARANLARALAGRRL